ncbi:hypothetical protein P5V15_001449 [Pogonomyrmex californicus]
MLLALIGQSLLMSIKSRLSSTLTDDLTTTKIGHNLNIDQSTVSRHLRKLGMVNKLDVWVPHELSEKNLMTEFQLAIRCINAIKTNHF